MALFMRMTLWKLSPSRMHGEMSSHSRVVVTGKTMSAHSTSFSSHGCWATTHSIFGLRKASMTSPPPPQQVTRQGVSVHIMWISVPPFSFSMG